MPYAFGDFELDEALFELRSCGERVDLRPQALDVFLHLARNRDRVVTKEELQQAVWSGASVSETAIPQSIVAIRRAIGEGVQDQRTIQTVRGRGYRFVAQVAQPLGESEVATELPFVGRESLLAAFGNLLVSAKDGHGGVVLVSGEAGAGKTRATLELARIARQEGSAVLSGRGYADEGIPLLWPWMQVLRAAQSTWPDRAFEILENPEASGDQFKTFDRVARALVDQARSTCVTVVLDDLHLADTPSILLLKMMAQTARDARLLIVATYRDTALKTNAVLGRAVGALARENPRRCFTLDPLGAPEVRALARAALGRELSVETIERVCAKTAGCPLFLAQVLYVMQIEERLATLPKGATSAMLSAQTMREAIGLHLHNLSDECRRVLSVASVLGRTFTASTLAQLMEVPEARALGSLDEARTARILDRKASEFVFVHGLVRDVLYKDLGFDERLRLHEKAASVLGDTDAAETHRTSARALVGG